MRRNSERDVNSRYGSSTPELEERLRFELKTIREMGFSNYFLIVADFIAFARRDGVSVGPGRGSAAGSLAAYCLLQVEQIGQLPLNGAIASRAEQGVDQHRRLVKPAAQGGKTQLECAHVQAALDLVPSVPGREREASYTT